MRKLCDGLSYLIAAILLLAGVLLLTWRVAVFFCGRFCDWLGGLAGDLDD